MDSSRIEIELEKLSAEFETLAEAVDAYEAKPEGFMPEWTIKNSISAILQIVYTNIENILMAILRETDSFQPSGDSFHKEVLERAASPVPGVREPLISAELKANLVHLLGFRHVMRKRYVQEIDLPLALANVERARTVIPRFRGEIQRFVTVSNQPKDVEPETGKPASKRKGIDRP